MANEPIPILKVKNACDIAPNTTFPIPISIILEKSGIKYEVNGNQDYCMPNTINLSITGVESEALMLSSKQFCGISNGSACTSHEYNPSYVLTAMGLDADRISSAIRISWGAHTDKDELINELSELIAVAKSLVF